MKEPEDALPLGRLVAGQLAAGNFAIHEVVDLRLEIAGLVAVRRVIYGTSYYRGPGYYGGGHGPGVGVGIGSVGAGLASVRAGNQSKPPF